MVLNQYQWASREIFWPLPVYLCEERGFGNVLFKYTQTEKVDKYLQSYFSPFSCLTENNI